MQGHGDYSESFSFFLGGSSGRDLFTNCDSQKEKGTSDGSLWVVNWDRLVRRKNYLIDFFILHGKALISIIIIITTEN